MNRDYAKKGCGRQTRWASFENPAAGKGVGGQENNGAKGRPCGHLKAGETAVLMEYSGAGEINRIWMTLGERSPAALRGLVLRCFWDNCEKPAVEVPLGDFMCAGGGMVPFESELFADPEGRSFNCYIPMPFRTGAKITLSNDCGVDLPWLFYDVNFTIFDRPQKDLLYFHSWFHRENPVALEKDHLILPKISGEGRFLGAAFTVNGSDRYADTWWGEGEVKLYLDGDSEFPTLVGTGTEDYIGTAWGQGQCAGRYQGCLVSDPERRLWNFYRFHLCDPVYFSKDISVSIQDIGGGKWQTVHELLADGVPLIPTTCDRGIKNGYYHLYKNGAELPKDGWINFYRQDDFATIAYFYLNRPSSDLPGIQSAQERMKGLEPVKILDGGDVVLIAE